MYTQEQTPVTITREYLSHLELGQLNDLFQHKNRLISVAQIAGIQDSNFFDTLRKELVAILAEIDARASQQKENPASA